MTTKRVRSLLLSMALVACTGTSSATSTTEWEPTSSTTSTIPATSTSVAGGFDVFVFYRTEGFRHSSIEAGIAAIERLGEEHGFRVAAGQDPTIFSESGLADFEVIVFLSTTGDILDPDEERAMQAFVESGGGFVGVHAAADTEYDWPWFGELVGAYFDSHPDPQEAVLEVVAAGHPIVADMPATFQRFDEWYNFRAPPGEDVTLLVTIDETSYQGGSMGQSHPISWAHETLGGRSFYTAMGHTEESFTDPLVLTHLGNGILWAAGLA